MAISSFWSNIATIQPEEEYIDLKPIFDDLYIDSAAFLKPVKVSK